MILDQNAVTEGVDESLSHESSIDSQLSQTGSIDVHLQKTVMDTADMTTSEAMDDSSVLHHVNHC